MTISALRADRRPVWLLIAAALIVGGFLLLATWARPLLPFGAGAAATRGPAPLAGSAPNAPRPTGPPALAWGRDVKVSIPFQQAIDHLPAGAPYVLRVTELEMEPGAKIFDHRQIGVGAHVVVRGSIQIDNLDAGHSTIYRAGQAYFEGLEPLHRAENSGAETNRILMVDLLSAARKFDGTQQFTATGRHNDGGLRSGPYAQVPLAELPSEPLMLRVTEMAFGPKAKMVEHTRLGPAIFFVQEGTATVRKDWDNSSMTYGSNGYFFESGRDPFILENKPTTPARFLSVELLPASLGDAPSTVPTGRTSDD